MNIVTVVVRAARLVLHLIKGVVIAAVLVPHCKPREQDSIISLWSLDCLRLLNVRIRIKGDRPPSQATAILFVANHVSWLDIVALNAIRRVRFVAKSEVRAWPVIGWLAARTGTIFLTRHRPRHLIRANRSIRAALRRGRCVAVFPEGTTSDGRTVRDFHSGLLEPAVAAQALVWPVTLRYRTMDGHQADCAAFVGEQSLLASIYRVLAQPVLYLNLEFSPPLQGSRFDRHELARAARTVIVANLAGGTVRPAANSHGPALSLGWSDEPTAAA